MRAAVVIAGICFLALPAWADDTSQLPSQSRPGRVHQGGQGVDRDGGPAVVDPTENVKALSEAANRRQDDLRLASEKYLQSRIDALEAVGRLRDDAIQNQINATTLRLDDLAKLRAEYAEKLSIAEAKRIDAIRAVDVNAVAVASTRATDQAQVLATQVSQSAEALRTLVATTASTVAASQQQLANTLSARLTTLEQAGYQQAGTAKFQDPQLAALVVEVKALSEANRNIRGVDTGRSDVVGWLVAGIMLLVMIAGSVIAVVTMARRSPPVQPILPVEPVYDPPRRSRR